MVSAVDDTGVTSTFSGLVNMVLASCWISFGIVAEKNSVCLFAGTLAMIFFTSCTKPMSSIRSASSSTSILIWSRWTKRWFIRSSRRPGVATKISTPRRKASVCGFCDTPPKITKCFKPGMPAVSGKALVNLDGQFAGWG